MSADHESLSLNNSEKCLLAGAVRYNTACPPPYRSFRWGMRRIEREKRDPRKHKQMTAAKPIKVFLVQPFEAERAQLLLVGGGELPLAAIDDDQVGGTVRPIPRAAGSGATRLRASTRSRPAPGPARRRRPPAPAWPPSDSARLPRRLARIRFVVGGVTSGSARITTRHQRQAAVALDAELAVVGALHLAVFADHHRCDRLGPLESSRCRNTRCGAARAGSASVARRVSSASNCAMSSAAPRADRRRATRCASPARSRPRFLAALRHERLVTLAFGLRRQPRLHQLRDPRARPARGFPAADLCDS